MILITILKYWNNGWNEKHTIIKDELHLYLMHTEMRKTVKGAMAMIVIGIIDLAVFSCFSVFDCSGNNVKICCSGVVCG